MVAGDGLTSVASLYEISVETLAAYNAWADGTAHQLAVGDEVKVPPGSPYIP